MHMTDVTPAHPLLNSKELPAILQLIRSENVGAMTFFSLVRRYGSAERALEQIPLLAATGGRKRPITIFPKAKAEEEIAKTLAFGARMVVYGEADYPSWLTTIPDAPPILILMGDSALWREKPLVAMVGARNASANGCNFARKIARELGEAGYVVVSGLARGIDTHAHRGALATGTVGVIAGGIDHVYPPENLPLYEEMRERGAVVTEHPYGMAPHARSFPSRNRIIAGMARGVIVVEASTHSGSLITARYANEQGREIMAIPGSPMDPRCQGTNALLKDGATLISSTQDVLNALNDFTPHATPKLTGFWEDEAVMEPSTPEQATGKEREMVEAKLSATPVQMEELLHQLPFPPSLILTILLEMELAGRIQRHPGGSISLSYIGQEAAVL